MVSPLCKPRAAGQNVTTHLLQNNYLHLEIKAAFFYFLYSQLLVMFQGEVKE